MKEEERVVRGLRLKEELNLRKGDRKEGEVLGEARVWENVGFRDCREEAAMVWCGGKTRRDESSKCSIMRNDYKWRSSLYLSICPRSI